MRRPDLATLISGLAIALLGTVLLLDQAGQLSLDFGSLAPLVLCVVGLVLLVGGLAKRDGA
ncbi:hypothetical protein DSM104299_02336 [Baekduia alba]|uniref:hypothetical protein n=1 Tax=Baekduia alba TaxID=2997333 RepID=UPI0023402143|nr:hypothetical protein [Baekduia alba]WCB93620.1 hypothetical protein DSM104299_02336 [Baekduia alba]